MIVLQRKTPERLLFYEVMQRRAQNPTKYEKLYAQAHIGYEGELRLDREWKDINVNGLLFHDFTCFNSVGHSHQIDTIFVCKHFVLVAEVKNVSGLIDFNKNTRQLLRQRKDGTIDAFYGQTQYITYFSIIHHSSRSYNIIKRGSPVILSYY